MSSSSMVSSECRGVQPVAARSFAAGVGLRGIGCLGLFADFIFARGFSLGFVLVLCLDIRLGSSVEHVFVRFDS
ncbi:MAG: hypothetical protein JJD97_11575 [Gemmatimonadaceae bacterium]|nr:hypothetical protein [Gemmatimonadaceae bacterium]